jgi:hypothetical protein
MDGSGKYHISNNAKFDEYLFLRKKALREDKNEYGKEGNTEDSAEDTAQSKPTSQNPAEESSTREVSFGVPLNTQIVPHVRNGKPSTTTPQSDATMNRATDDSNPSTSTKEGHLEASMESSDGNRNQIQHPVSVSQERSHELTNLDDYHELQTMGSTDLLPTINQDLPPELEEILSDDEEDDKMSTTGQSALLASTFALSTKAVEIDKDPDPKTFLEAITGKDRKYWQNSMDDEMESIVSNETWELVKLPKGRKAIGLKWVYKRKRGVDGQFNRFKSRLVVKGYCQKQGVDYDETWSPVANYSSVRMLLAIAASKDLDILQYDVKTAFLHGEIDVDDIYVKQPEGYVVKGKEHWVYRLKKSLYGLKQAPRIFNKSIHKVFVNSGFKQSKRDPCVYIKTLNDETTMLIIFVDDIIIASNVKHQYYEMFRQAKIDIQEIGELNHFLGIRILRDRSKRVITMDQTVYLDRVLAKHGMSNVAPVSTPMSTEVLTAAMSPKTSEEIQNMRNVPYRQAVGSIMYLAVSTRPDIAKAVSAVSKYLENPGQKHWNAVKRILRYLKGTRELKLHLGGTSEIELKVWSDADWAGDLDKRRSTTGYLVFLGDGPISWKSRLQPTVAASTTEAEYMAAFEACSEVMYLRPLLSELGFQQSKATKIYEDNRGCIAISKDPATTGRTKHIDIKYHFLREQVKKGSVKLVECFTDDMIADVLTKGLNKAKHTKFVKMLNLKTDTPNNSACIAPLSGSVGKRADEITTEAVSRKRRKQLGGSSVSNARRTLKPPREEREINLH